jgi:hypothetical protein
MTRRNIMVIKRVLKDGELSMCEKVEERIRELTNYSKEDFYGMCGVYVHVVPAFLTGLQLMRD